MRKVQVLGMCVLVGALSAGTAQAEPIAFCGDPSHGHSMGLGSSDFSLLGTKWEPGGVASTLPGQVPSPGGATWSIMGAGLGDVSGFDGGHVGTTQLMTALGVSAFTTVADYAAMLNAAFNVWSAAAMIDNLGQVADGGGGAGAAGAAGATGHIRFAAWDIATSGVLAHAFNPCDAALCGPGGNVGGDTHFDLSFNWEDDPTDTTADSDFDLFTVALHEIGHALGLGHSSVVGSVMEPFYGGARRSLHADDIAGIRFLYGERQTVPGAPEPVSLLLLGMGLGGYVYNRRRSN